MFKKIGLPLLLALVFSNFCYSQDKRPNIPFGDVGWKRNGRVGYQPVVQFFPEGISYVVGPVVVSDDRRYVRIGMNIGFSQVIGFQTFNFVTGENKNFK